MKGVRFYAEPKLGPKGGHVKRYNPELRRLADAGGKVNCIAADVDLYWDGRQACREGLGAVFDYDDSPVATTSFNFAYLRQCTRVSEALARRLHPALFERLDFLMEEV